MKKGKKNDAEFRNLAYLKLDELEKELCALLMRQRAGKKVSKRERALVATVVREDAESLYHLWSSYQ